MPRRGRSRSFEWGRARRPKISNKLGRPSEREGSDGDFQVRQTNLGARIFAKLAGRWRSSILHGDDIDNPDVFIPKAWTKDFTLPVNDHATDNSGGTFYELGTLPEFINFDDIISFTSNIYDSVGGNIIAPPPQYVGSSGTTVERSNAFFIITSSTRLIRVGHLGALWNTKQARITILYK